MHVFSIAFLALLGVSPGHPSTADDLKLKFTECPEAVRETLRAESSGSRIETVIKKVDEDDVVVFWAETFLNGKHYAIGVRADGTLSEMNLELEGDDEIPFDRCPAEVKATFQSEAYGEKIETVGRDLKYGVTTFEAVITHKGKSYQIVVAEDGTLVEKVLSIDDEDIEIAACPAPVQAALRKQGQGGTIHGITRSSGIGQTTYEAEVESKGKIYLIEVSSSGTLISKSLEADQD